MPIYAYQDDESCTVASGYEPGQRPTKEDFKRILKTLEQCHEPINIHFTECKINANVFAWFLDQLTQPLYRLYLNKVTFLGCNQNSNVVPQAIVRLLGRTNRKPTIHFGNTFGESYGCISEAAEYISDLSIENNGMLKSFIEGLTKRLKKQTRPEFFLERISFDTYLRERDYAWMADFLKYLPRLTCLYRLVFDQIARPILHDLLFHLQQCPNLKHLTIRSDNMLRGDCDTVSQALSRSHIKHLYLGSRASKCWMTVLCEALKTNRTLYYIRSEIRSETMPRHVERIFGKIGRHLTSLRGFLAYQFHEVEQIHHQRYINQQLSEIHVGQILYVLVLGIKKSHGVISMLSTDNIRLLRDYLC
jgi:hypothetical protein